MTLETQDDTWHFDGALARLHRAVAGQFQHRRFRGEIWEDDANIGLSQDSAQGNRPFDINTCRYWEKPLRDANRDSTHLMCITAANQIAKTLICEMIARHKIKHDPADMVLYDQSDEQSADHMKTRFMPFLRSIPAIAHMIQTVIAASTMGRFDVTNQDIMLPGMVLRGRPLNELNTQRITIRWMFIHDAALSERNGQLRRARIRLTQYLGRELLVVESQGGVIDEGVPDDFTELVAETDNADLWVTCPFCNRPQIFTLPGWQRRRADDFVPVPPVSVPSMEHEAWIAHHRELFLQPEHRVAGFKRGDELLARMGEGLFSEKDIKAHTCYECHDCGSLWNDTPDIRRKLDHSSHYVPTNLTAPYGKYGYRIPAWIAPRIPWGQIMFEKVVADNASIAGSELQIQEWETKRAAATYDPKAHMVKVASVTTTVDPLKAIPEELFRDMTVDCQKDKQLSAIKGEDMTGHFWVTAFATDKHGNDVQLWRGYCVSWDEWIAKYKELGIPTKNVSVDAAFKPDEIKAMAARHAEIVCQKCERTQRDCKFQCKCGVGGIYATWTMMRGSDQHWFRWDDGVNREYRIERPEEATIYGANNKVRVFKINVVTWSNFRFKSIVNAQLSRMPGMPSFTRLPDNSEQLSERTRAMETGNCTWDNQINSELIGKVGKRTQFVEVHKENHYRDDVCMHTVRKMQAGVVGRMEVAEHGAQKVES